MIARKALYRWAFITKAYITKVLILSIFWYMCLESYLRVKDVEPLQGFVPNEILGIAADAPLAKVKKAYRRLSREKHPDKNPDNPHAVTEFIQITKAYTIMTDPVAKDNFAKYGNPEGYGHFHVSIALPKVISDPEYQIAVLVIFFVVVTLIIPYLFYNYFSQEEKDIGKVSTKNRELFGDLIDENMSVAVIPGILG